MEFPIGYFDAMEFKKRDRIDDMLKKWEIDPSTLYDFAEPIDENARIKLEPGLSEIEKYDAKILAKYFWRGLILVTGLPGSGKDLFTKSTCWKFKRYFGRHVLLDDRPRPLFGPYLPFNEDILKREIKTSKLIAEGKVKESTKSVAFLQEYDDKFKEWMADKGSSWLRNGVLGLAEYQPYMNKRDPMSRMNRTMGSINRLWRHFGITIFGIIQKEEDLDVFRCLPYVTTRVSCTWMGNNTVMANIYPCKFVSTKEVLQMTGDKYTYYVNGKKPVRLLGDKCYFDLFNSQNMLSISGSKL